MTPRSKKYLEQSVGWGLIGLLAIMPFHAFLSVWMGSLWGHQELWQSWKEAVIVLLAAAVTILVAYEPERLKRGGKILPISALIFALIAAIVTIFQTQTITSIIFGLKTDFEFIVVFFIALWGSNPKLYIKIPNIILWTSGIVATFGILHATILPYDILTHFGYSTSTIEPYQLVGSLSDTIRTPSTLGGPNQLGSFLILPLCLAIALWFKKPRWSLVLASLLYTCALWFTYSRSAWIGAAAGVIMTVGAMVRTKSQIKLYALSIILLVIMSLAGLLAASNSNAAFNYIVMHSGAGIENNNSTTQHASALTDGISIAFSKPLGSGLGAAGPASFHAINGFIPENYYLQIAIETGFLGLIAFLTFLSATAIRLWGIRYRSIIAPALLGALAGISIVNIFLHGWADSSTAIIYWIAAGTLLAGKHTHV
jgi:O-antigen ligase